MYHLYGKKATPIKNFIQNVGAGQLKERDIFIGDFPQIIGTIPVSKEQECQPVWEFIKNVSLDSAFLKSHHEGLKSYFSLTLSLESRKGRPLAPILLEFNMGGWEWEPITERIDIMILKDGTPVGFLPTAVFSSSPPMECLTLSGLVNLVEKNDFPERNKWGSGNFLGEFFSRIIKGSVFDLDSENKKTKKSTSAFFEKHGRERLPGEPDEGFRIKVFRRAEKDTGECVILGQPFPKDFASGNLGFARLGISENMYFFGGGPPEKLSGEYLSLLTRREAAERLDTIVSLEKHRASRADIWKNLEVVELYFKRPIPSRFLPHIVKTLIETRPNLWVVEDPGYGPGPLLFCAQEKGSRKPFVVAYDRTEKDLSVLLGALVINNKFSKATKKEEPRNLNEHSFKERER